MNAITAVKMMALLIFLAGASAAGLKYVAVVETDMDAQSGASENLNPAEVRQITAELRRQATENLPSEKYSVMTSETVQSMGGAVLEECADENCVITLGSKIGADYIVRGIISKFGTKLTLLIELYETDNGMLVISSEPVRSENKAELLEMATAACANMYKKFAGAKGATRKSTPQPKEKPQYTPQETSQVQIRANGRGAPFRSARFGGNPRLPEFDYYIAPKYQQGLGPKFWSGANLEGGLIWGNGMFVGIDFGLGVYSYCIFGGGGVSFGNVYDFENQWQFVYGGSVGLWLGDWYDDYDSYHDIDIFAPFVKLRLKFFELTYRGLFGWEREYFDYYKKGFNYSQQLMLGLYFATSKRER
jgi:hypothetical protein